MNMWRVWVITCESRVDVREFPGAVKTQPQR